MKKVKNHWGAVKLTKFASAAPSDPQDYMRKNICPICHNHFIRKPYLIEGLLNDPKASFIVQLVLHYREAHIRYWKVIEEGNGKSRYRWFKNPENEERKVNETSKRQIIRQATSVLIVLGVTSETFRAIQNTDEKTIDLAVKKLDKRNDL